MNAKQQSKCTRLYWHGYKYLPYERQLAVSEIQNYISTSEIREVKDYVEIEGRIVSSKLKQLAYFSHFQNNGHKEATLQFLSEFKGAGEEILRRQSTRYSSHGLHEYKGKFNPQVVRGLLNILKVGVSDKVLDPFCGSGTSLVECAHKSISATGFDINPLAVYISNAKIQSLSIDPLHFLQQGKKIIALFKNKIDTFKNTATTTPRQTYLSKWFPKEEYRSITLLKALIDDKGGEFASIYLVLASNLLRDYSLQEPADLRIRKRRSPRPTKPLITALEEALEEFYKKILAVQEVYGAPHSQCQAHLVDSRYLSSNPMLNKYKNNFSVAITSPPYATALPYIDTQRLSLVWLGLCEASSLLDLDAQLTGSRELRGQQKKIWGKKLAANESDLPESLLSYCQKLTKAIGASDGFRRQAVPFLLYRYFADMKLMFKEVKKALIKNGRYALIVGHNHTVLGGKRFDINTPDFLVKLAEATGWNIESNIPLETYRRYSLHSANSIASEALLILKAK